MTTQTTGTGTGGGRIARSIGAIVAAFVVVAVISLATDQVLHWADVYPPWGVPMLEVGDNFLALAYRLVYGVLGGWVVARLAPYAPMRHAIILGAIGTALSALGAYAMWGMGLDWYPVLLALSALPTAWLGARIFIRSAGR